MAKTGAGVFTVLLVVLASFCPVTASQWTSHGFFYKPDLGARGTAEKNTYDSGLDRVDARLSKEIWVGDPNYGSTIQAAISALGSNPAVLRVPAGTHSIVSNLVVPSNLVLKPERGVTLAIPNSVTLTINGGLDAGLYQIFSCTGTGKVVFARGAVKELVPQWWGAKGGDGSTDDLVPLQAMVDCSVASGGIDIFLPGGDYRISDTWKANKGAGYSGFKVRGAGSSSTAGVGTLIDATAFGDRPAINIQGARRIVLEDLRVIGKNAAPLTAAATLDPTLANWITAGCVDSQFAPYAGIAIDAYQGAKPAGGHDNDAYGRLDSSYVTLRNVAATGFVVGLCIAPCNASVDSDAVTLDTCQLSYNTYGYSSGGSQSRSIIFQNTDVYGNWCCFTTLRHGQKIGNAPSIFGGIMQTSHKLFELGAANGANTQTISGVHAESFGWLGELGVTDSGSSIPIIFSGCQLACSGSAYQPFFLVAHRKVKFQGCLIRAVDDGSGPLAALNLAGSAYYGRVDFDNCNLIGLANSKNAFVGLRDQNFLCQSFRGCSAESIGYSDTGGLDRFSLNRDLDLDIVHWTYYITRFLIAPGVANVTIQGTPYKLDRLNDYGHNSSSFGFSGMSLSGTTHGNTLTFTASNPADFQVGDLLLWRVWEPYAGNVYYNLVPAFKVTDNSAGAVTAVALFDGIDDTYASGLGGFYVCTPFILHPNGSVGDTHSNTTVDNVTNIANWKVGDFIRGAGIPANTRIANIAGTTITLSKDATPTASGVALYNCRLMPY